MFIAGKLDTIRRSRTLLVGEAMDAMIEKDLLAILYRSYALAAMSVVFANCGGQSQSSVTSTSPIGGSTVQTQNSSGGHVLTGGTTSTGSTVHDQNGGGGSGSTGGTTNGGTSASSCDQSPLWNAVRYQAVGPAGQCWVVNACSSVCDAGSSPSDGAIVIDSQGYVIDNTGIAGAAKQAWIASLASQNWPCLAGQTITYACTVNN